MSTKHGEKAQTFIEDGDYALWDLFNRSSYAAFRARERELQRYDITPQQTQILLVAKALKDAATPAEIGRLILHQPHTISSLVKRMETKGLVRASKGVARRNLVTVILTEEGEKAFELTTKRGPIHRIINSLDSIEKEQFRNCLKKIMSQAREELGLDREILPLSEWRPDES